MKATKNRPPLGQRVEEALRDGIAFARGEVDLQTTLVPLGRTYSAEEVVSIRTKRHLSQSQFARLLAVNVKTLQSWEQGARVPSRPTMRLLQVFDEPEAFRPILQFDEQRKHLARKR